MELTKNDKMYSATVLFSTIFRTQVSSNCGLPHVDIPDSKNNVSQEAKLRVLCCDWSENKESWAKLDLIEFE